jgi:hypothetical protein
MDVLLSTGAEIIKGKSYRILLSMEPLVGLAVVVSFNLMVVG